MIKSHSGVFFSSVQIDFWEEHNTTNDFTGFVTKSSSSSFIKLHGILCSILKHKGILVGIQGKFPMNSFTELINGDYREIIKISLRDYDYTPCLYRLTGNLFTLSSQECAMHPSITNDFHPISMSI